MSANVFDSASPSEFVDVARSGVPRVSDSAAPSEAVAIEYGGPIALTVFDVITPTDGAVANGTLLAQPVDVQGGGGGGAASDLWRPAWLLDLSGISPMPPGYTAADLRFSHVDIEAVPSGIALHHGRIVDQPTIDRKLGDVFWGVPDVAEILVTLSNADGFLTNLFLADIREQPVVLRRYDIAGGVVVDTINGRIASPGIENGKVIFRIVSIALTLSEQPVPSRLITTAEFPRAVDLQAPIPVVFGNPIQMPCPYINDDTLQNEYDYVVGYGTVTVSQLYRNGPNNTMEKIHTTEYTVSTSLYPGYTVVRFPLRQIDFSAQFHKIYADVVGASRNFVDAIEEILTNATWGLGQTVDAASFAAAATTLDNLSSMFCDGVLAAQVQAQDVLRQLLIVRGMRLGFNSTGQWTIAVDQIPTTIVMVVNDGTGDGQRNIVTAGPRILAETQNAVSTYTVQYRPDFPNNSAFQFSQTRTVNAFGKVRTFQSLFIRDHTTADMVCDYLAKREKYAQDTAELELPQEARRLVEGNLVQVFYAGLGYAGDVVEVQHVAKTLETVRVTVASWDAEIYFYQPGVVPADTPPPTGPDPVTVPGLPTTAPTPPAVPTGLAVRVSQDVGLSWSLEQPPRAGVGATLMAASVFIDDLTVYAFHTSSDSVPALIYYDVSLDGGKTFPSQRPTAYTFTPTTALNGVVAARTLRLINGGLRVMLLLTGGAGFIYSDNVLSLPSASTWTNSIPATALNPPMGFELRGYNVVAVFALNGTSEKQMYFSVDGGQTWTLSSLQPLWNISTATANHGNQIFASPATGVWCHISPPVAFGDAVIYRSVDYGNTWSQVKTLSQGSTPPPTDPRTCIFAYGTRLIAIHYGHVSVSDDLGLTWTDKQDLTLLVSDPSQANLAMIGNFGTVLGAVALDVAYGGAGLTKSVAWRSTDGGETWTQVPVVGAGGIPAGFSGFFRALVCRNGRAVLDAFGGSFGRWSWYSTPEPDTPVFVDVSWIENQEIDIQGYEIQYRRESDAIWTSRTVGTL